MATPITLTQQPVRYTTAAGAGFQPIYLAFDVSGFDMLDVEAGLTGVEGAVSAFTLDLYTGMQTQTDDGWVSVGSSLLSTTSVNSWNKVSISTGLLRFVRWRVSTITGGTAATFFIRGMGRSYT